MASSGGRGIVVWEWLNEYGTWLPYEPHVTKFIEDNKAAGLLRLGQIDQNLSNYVINTNDFEQVTQHTGTVYPIRREEYPNTNCLAIGVVWQWEGDLPNSWSCYELHTMDLIEAAYNRKQSEINLQQSPCQLPYTINFKDMLQKKIPTGFLRRVKRFQFPYKYPEIQLSKSSFANSARSRSSSVKTAAAGASSSQAAASSANQLPQRAAGDTKFPLRGATNGGLGHIKIEKQEVWMKFVTVVTQPPDEDCCICCENLTSESGYGETHGQGLIFKLTKCSHVFHDSCLHAMYENGPKNGHLQCPTCKTIYGEKLGNCPPGTMTHTVMSQSLPGYSNCGTIAITYNISSGTQGPEHPHPGRRYYTSGFPRTGYLPDNDKGRKVLKLLKIAWDRKLTFTISQSVTTGQSDTVTWNEIHHKTEFGSNASGHGYPDPNYLDNVLMELSVQGVTEDLLKS